jgi:hypothetical protein
VVRLDDLDDEAHHRVRREELAALLQRARTGVAYSDGCSAEFVQSWSAAAQRRFSKSAGRGIGMCFLLGDGAVCLVLNGA